MLSTSEKHHVELRDEIREIKEEVKKISLTLTPIAETYGTVIRLGKWGKWFLGFVLLAITTFVAIKELLKK